MIDFHCHLDLYPNAYHLACKVAERNHYTLVVTTSPRAWLVTSKVFADFDNIKVALGLHPEIVQEKLAERELLISCIRQAGIIGEVGIDGSLQYHNTIDLQESILHDVLLQSERCGGKILSIHSRNAESKVLFLIERLCRNSIPVLHWFSGTIEETRRAVALGCWFSIGPPMLHGAKGLRILHELPVDRILPESDGPFAMNGSSPYMPWEAIKISSMFAGTWNMTEDEVHQQFIENLSRLLGNDFRSLHSDRVLSKGFNPSILR